MAAAVHALNAGEGAEVDDAEEGGDVRLTEEDVHGGLVDGWAGYFLVEIAEEAVWRVG